MRVRSDFYSSLYPFWMQDGSLAGARFDGAIDTDTGFTTNGLPLPALGANDSDTAAKELRTYLILTSSADSGEGMFSIGSLPGCGTASEERTRFVDTAVDTISRACSDVAALLSLETKPTGAKARADGQEPDTRHAVPDESADDDEAQIHQGRRS